MGAAGRGGGWDGLRGTIGMPARLRPGPGGVDHHHGAIRGITFGACTDEGGVRDVLHTGVGRGPDRIGVRATRGEPAVPDLVRHRHGMGILAS